MIEEMSPHEINEFILAQKIGRVGCHAEGETYVVPVIYAWRDGCVYVYTTEGKKIEFMRRNAKVCFEIDEYLASGSWRSVIIQGTYEELRDEEAARALAILVEHVRPNSSANHDEDRGGGRVPVAFRIRASDVTGRKVDRNF